MQRSLANKIKSYFITAPKTFLFISYYKILSFYYLKKITKSFNKIRFDFIR